MAEYDYDTKKKRLTVITAGPGGSGGGTQPGGGDDGGTTIIVDAPDATATDKGVVALAGDFAGTADFPRVPRLDDLDKELAELVKQVGQLSTAAVTRAQRVWSLERDFGGKGDNSSDNAAAFAAAWAAMASGDTLTLGAGIFLTSKPVAPTKSRCSLVGVGSSWWTYNDGGSVAPCAIRAHSTFTGSAVVWGRDKELNVDSSGASLGEVNNCTIANITIDGNSFGTNV